VDVAVAGECFSGGLYVAQDEKSDAKKVRRKKVAIEYFIRPLKF